MQKLENKTSYLKSFEIKTTKYKFCEIMLKLCVLNVKTRLLYYKAKLMLFIPMSANKAECF